jgi:putative Ca2+/H+ antiporter (TMEM165/GDT1 family)
MILALPLSGPGRAMDRRSLTSRPEEDHHVEQAFLVSTGAVALAEIGDKTQLLSLVLAARYRKPVPIMLGVLAATLVNHACAGAIGAWLGALITPGIMRWALGVSFVVMGLWVLVPDKLDPKDTQVSRSHLGVFGTTIVTFFLAEMGDKTQIATVALAARFHDFFGVVAGTTLGMMLANVPAIVLGDRFAHRLPTKLVHGIAAALFVALGALALLGIGI